MPQLGIEGSEERVEVVEVPGRSGLRSQLATGTRIPAVVQGQLEYLRQVEVAGENVGLLAERADFDTTAATAGAGIFERLALADLLGDHRVGIEDRRKSEALADDPQCVLEQSIGGLARQLDVRARLQQVHLVDDLQQEV